MLPQKNRQSLQSPLRLLSVLVFHLLLTHSCRGESQLIGPSQPIVANVGDDVMLPCHLEPAVDISAMTLEWTRPDMNPEFVYVWRGGQDLISARNPSYKGRTSLSADGLKKGNMSVKISKVKPSDVGRYTCFIPRLNKASVMELVVGAVSSPVINLAGIDRNRGGVMLDCDSVGWYPEPEVLWLDGEGNLLSAGPTETVRGPDDLYTVSSRVTVEKRHSNSFTCRVQQKDTNHMRETNIQISDDFFEVQSSSAPLIVGWAVSLAVCFLIILLLIFFVWKQKQKNNKTRRSNGDETDKRNKNRTNSSENQSVTEERETEQLMMEPAVKMMVSNIEEKQKTKHSEDKLQRTEEQNIPEVTEETQRGEDVSKVEFPEEKATESSQLEGNEAASSQSSWFSSFPWTTFRRLRDEQQRREAAEKDVKSLKKQLKTMTEERDQNKSQVDQLSADIKELKEEKQSREEELKELKEELEKKNTEVVKLSHELHNLKEEKQRREREQQQQQQVREELEYKRRQVDQLSTDNKKLQQEKQRREEELKELKEELEKKKKEWEKKFQVEKTQKEKAEKTVRTLQEELKRKSTGPVIVDGVNQLDTCIRLRNTSEKDQELKGWTLQVLFGHKENITYTFVSFTLKAGETVNVRSSRSFFPSPVLLWEELSWIYSKKPLQVTLICKTGKIQHHLP